MDRYYPTGPESVSTASPNTRRNVPGKRRLKSCNSPSIICDTLLCSGVGVPVAHTTITAGECQRHTSSACASIPALVRALRNIRQLYQWLRDLHTCDVHNSRELVRYKLPQLVEQTSKRTNRTRLLLFTVTRRNHLGWVRMRKHILDPLRITDTSGGVETSRKRERE